MNRSLWPLLQPHGISLAELLMALGVVSVITAFAGHALSSAVSRAQRLTATAQLATELRGAHRLAIAERRPIRANFDVPRSLLELQDANDPEHVYHRYHYGPQGIGRVMLSRGTSVVFYPSGRAASPVTLTVTTTRGDRAKITVSITGKVSWS